MDEAWYDALLPGLSATAKRSELSPRRQEVLHTMQKLAEAYWQALPINFLKHGMNAVTGLPRVMEVMQTDEYASFSEKVMRAECDSMEKLDMMQEVPYLAEWQQAKCARKEPQQVTHHATGISTESSRAREQSQLRSAKAAGIVSQEPPAKWQKVAHSAADKEQQMLAELEQLRSQRRQTELQLHIDTEKQAMLELGQQQESLRRRQLMWDAQDGSAVTKQVMSASTSNQVLQPQNILVVQNQVALSVSSTAEDSSVPAAQPSKVEKVFKNPDMFKARTTDGRYKEWVGGGQYPGIKSQVSRSIRGWELPRKRGTEHAEAASTNLRRHVHLPEAVEHLVMQGLSGDAAVALVTQVVSDFGLTSISTQSEAFAELYKLEKAARAGDAAQVAKPQLSMLRSRKSDDSDVSLSSPNYTVLCSFHTVALLLIAVLGPTQ